jgi:hypothetical protein
MPSVAMLDSVRSGCSDLNASQRSELSVKLYSRYALSPLCVVVVDALLSAGSVGLALDQLAEKTQLPAGIVSNEVDALRLTLLATASGEQNTSPHFFVDFRKALSHIASHIGAAFVALQLAPLRLLPRQMQEGVVSSVRREDTRQEESYLCCTSCVSAHPATKLRDGVLCPLCGAHVGFHGCEKIAEAVLGNAPLEQQPFYVPPAMKADRRLCLAAVCFAALFSERFCSLTSADVIRSSTELLNPKEKARFTREANTHTLKFRQPRHLRVNVVSQEEQGLRRVHVKHHNPLPPWLAPDSERFMQDNVSSPSTKRHRAELVCAAQTPADGYDFEKVF